MSQSPASHNCGEPRATVRLPELVLAEPVARRRMGRWSDGVLGVGPVAVAHAASRLGFRQQDGVLVNLDADTPRVRCVAHGNAALADPAGELHDAVPCWGSIPRVLGTTIQTAADP